MNESMDISFNLEDHQDQMDLNRYVMDLDLSLETLVFESQMEIPAIDELWMTGRRIWSTLTVMSGWCWK